MRMLMDSKKTPALLEPDMFKMLEEGLTKAFKDAVYFSGSSSIGSDSRMRAAQATAQIAEALMRLQDRKPD